MQVKAFSFRLVVGGKICFKTIKPKKFNEGFLIINVTDHPGGTHGISAHVPHDNRQRWKLWMLYRRTWRDVSKTSYITTTGTIIIQTIHHHMKNHCRRKALCERNWN